MEQVLGDTGSLCLPVAPDTHGGMMDMVAAENNVNSSMELDGGDLSTAKLLHVVDMMNMVVLDDREDTTHTAYDTGLLTVMDMTAANDMAAYLFLQPAVILSAANCVTLHLSGAFNLFVSEIVIVIRIKIFSK